MTSATESADHVSVHLTGCGRETADAVIAALDAAFPASPGTLLAEKGGPVAKEAAPGKPVIWCTVVDTRARRARTDTAPVPLGTPVSVDLFGAAQPVRQVQEELAAAFGVEEHGTVPGEHELEVRLLLTPVSGTSSAG
ncbi:hypothetical protein [Streptomyces sp. I05A-00742]|uniref:hypothetical protein n=1 Tax=Streptomyces sp. I05A-00742 TaxID=2732853 RepID=UPI001488173B|nr:hypothetical protein [Streptomyces sp. I05A-00742]